MEWRELITGLQHIGIPTRDLEATVAFYQSLGFACEHRTRNASANETVAFLRLGNVTIETYTAGGPPRPTGSIDHIALNVTDIDAAWNLAEQNGCVLPEEGISFLPFWEKGVRFFTFSGPNGEKIEFNQKL